MKAFSLFLVELNDGSTHAGLTGDFAGYVDMVRDTSGYVVLLGTP